MSKKTILEPIEKSQDEFKSKIIHAILHLDFN